MAGRQAKRAKDRSFVRWQLQARTLLHFLARPPATVTVPLPQPTPVSDPASGTACCSCPYHWGKERGGGTSLGDPVTHTISPEAPPRSHWQGGPWWLRQCFGDAVNRKQMLGQPRLGHLGRTRVVHPVDTPESLVGSRK